MEGALAQMNKRDQRKPEEKERWKAVLVDFAKEWREVQRRNSKNTNGICGASFIDYAPYLKRLRESDLPAQRELLDPELRKGLADTFRALYPHLTTKNPTMQLARMENDVRRERAIIPPREEDVHPPAQRELTEREKWQRAFEVRSLGPPNRLEEETAETYSERIQAWQNAGRILFEQGPK